MLKMLPASWAYVIFWKGVWLHNGNIGSVGQRASKLPSIKLWEWFEPERNQIQAECFD